MNDAEEKVRGEYSLTRRGERDRHSVHFESQEQEMCHIYNWTNMNAV